MNTVPKQSTESGQSREGSKHSAAIMCRTVLVTGSASGIGLGIAGVFKRAGWTVIGCDRLDAHNVQRDIDCVHDHYVRVDLTQDGDVARLFEEVSSRYEQLDALVNNAGINHPVSFLEDFSVDDFDKVLRVNLRAPWLMVKTFLPLLKRAKGAVVNMGSVHAVATTGCMSAYAASKGGIAAMTRAMAVELGKRHGVRVNCVNPGAVDTPLHRRHLQAELESTGDGAEQGASAESLMHRWSARNSVVGRVGRPEEIGRCVLFLCDGEMSAFVTGECVLVDGGLAAQLTTGE